MPEAGVAEPGGCLDLPGCCPATVWTAASPIRRSCGWAREEAWQGQRYAWGPRSRCRSGLGSFTTEDARIKLKSLYRINTDAVHHYAVCRTVYSLSTAGTASLLRDSHCNLSTRPALGEQICTSHLGFSLVVQLRN